jgi:hypothetical protein
METQLTLIKPKYDYRKLSRVEIDGKRRYDWGGGIPVPSVTTILGATKDQSHLHAWRARVGHQKAQEITTEAGSVGTRMHKYLETYVETGEWPSAGSNPYAQQAHKMASVIRDKAMIHVDQIWGSEVALYVPEIYAGTTDLVGTFKGNPAILDFKQTNKPKKLEWVEDYFLQLTAYAIGHNEVHGTDIRQGHIFMCSRALEYQQFDIWPNEFDDWSQEWWKRVQQYYEENA